jgi:hypothetical protein
MSEDSELDEKGYINRAPRLTSLFVSDIVISDFFMQEAHTENYYIPRIYTDPEASRADSLFREGGESSCYRLEWVSHL